MRGRTRRAARACARPHPRLPRRSFQFVNMVKVMAQHETNKEVAFAIAALMEIPEQYVAIRELGYIG